MHRLGGISSGEEFTVRKDPMRTVTLRNVLDYLPGPE